MRAAYRAFRGVWMWERPSVISDGLYLCYWFCQCDCFWLFLRFGRGFVDEDVVAGFRAVAFALVLPSAVFGFQQPAYGVQYLAHFGFWAGYTAAICGRGLIP